MKPARDKRVAPDSSGANEKDNPVSGDSAGKKKGLSYSSLYRYATPGDWVLMLIGSLSAIVVGLAQPLMSIVFGDLLLSLIVYPISKSPTKDDDLRSAAVQGVTKLFAIGISVGICAFLMFSLWSLTGERQAKRIREEYLTAILRQEVAWFDKTTTGDLTTRMTADITTVQEGLSDKVPLILQFFTTFVAGFVIAFTKGPKLAAVLCCAFPLLGGAAMLVSKVMKKRMSSGTEFYAEAGGVAQEVLAGIRTVTAFGGQERAFQRYREKLKGAEKEGISASIGSGVSIGTMLLIMFNTYALAFWYGGKLINEGSMDGGKVVNTFMAIIIGAFSLGNIGPNLTTVSSAVGAATKIFETIDRESTINALSKDGEKLDNVKGVIEFKDVDFHYPQRPDVPILKNFSLKIQPGQTVAFVGASGSGKSTVVKLVERFYDPFNGTVTLDGKDLSNLNIKWLREQIGFVGQEPVLFDKTIKENLILGMRDGAKERLSSKEISKRVEEACKTANAWDFINKLPLGVDTNVGESGGMMSGGQKQRIAIARAIMREPSILLLDEATSALDTQSERLVQAALDQASQNRTTLVIAHRLSTIKNADLIVVMGGGQILEQGTHNELIAKGGAYCDLVNNQALREVTESAGPSDPGYQPKPVHDYERSDSVPTIESEKGKTKRSGNSMQQLAAAALSMVGSSANLLSSGNSKRKNSNKTEQLLKEEEEKKEIAAAKQLPMPWKRLLKISQPEWYLYILGGICSAGAGVMFPMFSLIFSSVINVFSKTGDELLSGVAFWAVMFVLLAIGGFVANFGSIAFFGIAGERMTRRLREITFKALLRQEIGFFDVDKNSTGALTAKLAEDASLVKGIMGRNMGSILQALTSLIAGLTIAFTHGWALTLIVLCAVPFIAVAGSMQMKVLHGSVSKTKEAYEAASVIANEVIDQIRTVLTLTKEQEFLDRYKSNIAEPHKIALKGAFAAGAGFGLSQSFIFLTYALSFYAGSQLVLLGKMEAGDVLSVMFAVIFTAMAIGQASSLAPNLVKAKIATFNIFALMDRESKIDPSQSKGIQQPHNEVIGIAKISDAKFSYPSRPNIPILQGLSIEAQQGKTIAFVGPSGCGKSTVIALLERWYDVHEGRAEFDHNDVRSWNISNLRTHLALVGQEPILFNQSIRENIIYGALNGTATQEEVEAAAKKANIHDFVMSLPEGYDTVVGSKGGQLSGGQKQRVAIARALVRNPKLLLLDEATSALDSESEKVVQEALDVAAKGRTTIVIAHRLSTIQTADHIAVVKAGRVIEQGTYDELLRQNGEFAQLVAAQSLSQT